MYPNSNSTVSNAEWQRHLPGREDTPIACFKHEPVDLGYSDLDAETSKSGRKYILPSGGAYPSITTVLSILSEKGIAEWRARVGEEEANKISVRASRRGTSVHEIIEKYLDNNPDYMGGYTPDIIESFRSVRGVLNERIGKIYGQELPLYSDHLRVAGRVDCVAEFDGKISIIDFKTSRKAKQSKYIESYYCQEAAYAIMWEERTGMPITQLVTIISVDDMNYTGPGYQVFIQKRDDWVPKLRETIDVYYQTRH